jgi:hypothetical protein
MTRISELQHKTEGGVWASFIHLRFNWVKSDIHPHMKNVDEVSKTPNNIHRLLAHEVLVYDKWKTSVIKIDVIDFDVSSWIKKCNSC